MLQGVFCPHLRVDHPHRQCHHPPDCLLPETKHFESEHRLRWHSHSSLWNFHFGSHYLKAAVDCLTAVWLALRQPGTTLAFWPQSTKPVDACLSHVHCQVMSCGSLMEPNSIDGFVDILYYFQCHSFQCHSFLPFIVVSVAAPCWRSCVNFIEDR